jgi:hypothetical protein
MPLEKLHFPLVFLRCGAAAEGPEIPPLPAGAFLSRVQTVLT